jgi:ferredoxin
MEDDEVDMLDLAFEVTDTSRLGCQIKVRKDMAGMKVRGSAADALRRLF